jgi:hypothetical protein
MADTKHFLLRLDPRLFEAIRGWAHDDLRSINAQIEYLLADQARRAGRLPFQRKPRPPDASSPPDIDDDGDPETPTAPLGAFPRNARQR